MQQRRQDGGILNDAVFAKRPLRRFKLRLDQADKPAVRLEDAVDGRKNFRQRNKGHIGGYHIHHTADIVRREMARICALEHLYALVAAQLPREDAVSDVHRAHRRRAALQPGSR